MNPVFLFLSALLLFTAATEAATWHTLQTRAKMTLQADEPLLETVEKDATDQEKKKDKKLKIWDKITYSRPQQADPGDFYYTAAKSMAEINCTTHTLKSLRRIYYDGDDNVVKSIHYDANERLEVVVPDTSGELVFNFACTFKTEKPIIKAAPRPKTDQSATGVVTGKGKEPQKSPAAASATSPAKPAPTAPTAKPTAPTAKPADTKKTAP